MTFQSLANTKLVIRPFETGDADEFVRAAHESIETVRNECTDISETLHRERRCDTMSPYWQYYKNEHSNSKKGINYE